MDLGLVAVFEASSWVVDHVPATFRSAGVCLLFFTFWCLNIYGFERTEVPYRLALGLKKSDADLNLNLSSIKYAWLWFAFCLGLCETATSLGHPRAAHFSALLLWLMLVLVIVLSPSKFFVAFRNTVSDFVKTIIFFREVCYII